MVVAVETLISNYRLSELEMFLAIHVSGVCRLEEEEDQTHLTM
jgi:hypothetical protein